MKIKDDIKAENSINYSINSYEYLDDVIPIPDITIYHNEIPEIQTPINHLNNYSTTSDPIWNSKIYEVENLKTPFQAVDLDVSIENSTSIMDNTINYSDPVAETLLANLSFML